MGAVLPSLDPEKAPGQAQIKAFDAREPILIHLRGLPKQRVHVGQRIPGSVLRQIRKHVVQVVSSDERGVHRAVLVVRLEEAIEPVGRRRGVLSHRACVAFDAPCRHGDSS
jgi:hypothetical protein